ncbi:WD repeat-containing protein 75 [Bagarius yarrelli]|uniref:WD repeat-containing protein 75 n=1 Tax=Bagarius yarrelli TaxID=175774 RepID=A0A556V6M1_BAGYA|nr:WD repeat-containing protein 75 [Bagarius yarrelli]
MTLTNISPRFNGVNNQKRFQGEEPPPGHVTLLAATTACVPPTLLLTDGSLLAVARRGGDGVERGHLDHFDHSVSPPGAISEPRPLFTQKSVCSGKVQRSVFAPRDQPLDSCDERTRWLNRSRLYFLTENMDLLTFSTRTEDERILNSRKQLLVDDSVAVTPFYLLLGKHNRSQEQKDSGSSQTPDRVQLPQGSVAIKELLHTPAHVLPAASVLCSMFVKSLLISSGSRKENEPLEQEAEESEKEEVDSEEEMETSDCQLEARTLGSVLEPKLQLSKVEERELKSVRKTDFSWVSSSINS